MTATERAVCGFDQLQLGPQLASPQSDKPRASGDDGGTDDGGTAVNRYGRAAPPLTPLHLAREGSRTRLDLGGCESSGNA